MRTQISFLVRHIARYDMRLWSKAYPFLSDAEACRFDTARETKSSGNALAVVRRSMLAKGISIAPIVSVPSVCGKKTNSFPAKKKKLTKKIAKELLDKGWCRVTGLYTPKKPQLYDAVIRLNDTGGKYVSFKMEFDR